MSRFSRTAIALSIALGLSAGVATAADTPAPPAPSGHKTMWTHCEEAGASERDRCMLDAGAKDSSGARDCKERMSRAQRRCMLDFLEAKRPLAEAK